MRIRVPHPVWFLAAALVLGAVSAGLHLGEPAYQRWTAIRAIGPSGYLVDVLLRGTKITDTGITELQRALPKLTIFHD